jgi:hypothetical protein
MLGLVPSIHAFIATNLWSLRRLIHHGVSTACGDPQAPQNFGTELGRGEHWAFVFFSVYLRPCGRTTIQRKWLVASIHAFL